MGDVLLVVPPSLRSTMGPLLGTAVLAAELEARGVRVVQRDLAIRFVREAAGARFFESDASCLSGDHATSPEIRELARAQTTRWMAPLLPAFHDLGWVHDNCALEQNELESAVRSGARSPHWAEFFEHHLFGGEEAPRVFGVSILFGGQVVPALVLCLLARQHWPSVRIVIGGAHVSLLPAGTFERPTLDMFDRAVRKRVDAVNELLRLAGVEFSRLPPSMIVPRFQLDELQLYRPGELTLPYQLSTGCPYGRCRYCTYTALEGDYSPRPLDEHLPAIRRLAVETGVRRFSFKDSLMTPARLRHVARAQLGIEWAACTKVHRSLDKPTLAELYAGGLRTLELGFETNVPRLQNLIDKPESLDCALAVVEACRAAGVRSLVNRIRFDPWQTPAEHAEDDAAFERLHAAGAEVEENRFQLQRGSRFGRERGHAVVRDWPWATTRSILVSRPSDPRLPGGGRRSGLAHRALRDCVPEAHPPSRGSIQ